MYGMVQKEVRSVQYKMVLTPSERRLLDAVGTPVQWRTFNLVIAMAVNALKEKDILKDGEPLDLKDLNFAGAFEQVFNYGPLNRMTEDTFERLINSYMEGDK
jgi:hypothetical protein